MLKVGDPREISAKRILCGRRVWFPVAWTLVNIFFFWAFATRVSIGR